MSTHANPLLTWIQQRLLPWYVEMGWDPVRGGFSEAILIQQEDCFKDTSSPQRLMLQSRCLFVLTKALRHQLTLRAPTTAQTHRLLEWLIATYRDPEQGGFFYSTDRPHKNLYALAFLLLGLGSYYRTFQDENVARLIVDTWEFIDSKLKHPQGGYREQSHRTGQLMVHGHRAQNPHMHLLEALLFLRETALENRSPFLKGGDFTPAIEHILSLFEHHFRSEAGVLSEHFHDAWALPGTGMLAEPGHHFEWCWLLDWYEKQTKQMPPALRTARRQLWAFATAYGVDSRRGGVYFALDGAGRLLDTKKRIWATLEYFKVLSCKSSYSLQQQTTFLLNHFLHQTEPFLWHEYLGTARMKTAICPLSTGYHFITALFPFWSS